MPRRSANRSRNRGWQWPNTLVGWMKFSGAVISLAAVITVYANLPFRMAHAEQDLESLEVIANYFKQQMQTAAYPPPTVQMPTQPQGWPILDAQGAWTGWCEDAQGDYRGDPQWGC